MKRNLKTLGDFVGHMMMGAAMFFMLLLFSGLLHLLVQWVGHFIGDDSFAALMKGVEQVFLYADVGFLLVWVVLSAYMATKKLMFENFQQEGSHQRP